MRLDSSPTNKMQNRTEKFGAQLPLFAPASSTQRYLYRKSTTYLGMIAVVLRDAPDKMLTFAQVIFHSPSMPCEQHIVILKPKSQLDVLQLMDKLGPFIIEDRKSAENSIRVCLSTNKCFHKVNIYIIAKACYVKCISLFYSRNKLSVKV